MPARFRSTPAALAALLAAAPVAARAQTTGTGCADLATQYDQAIRTADGLVTAAVEHALKATDPFGVLKQLDLAGQGASPEQAVRRGALAALPPTTQGAVLIYLVRANTAMQALLWKAARRPAGIGTEPPERWPAGGFPDPDQGGSSVAGA